MVSLKQICLFIQQNLRNLKRNWFSLPLLLLFPVIIIGTAAYIFISFMSQEKSEPIQVGLIDLDQSKETQAVLQQLEESSHMGNYITIRPLTKEKAVNQLKDNQISAYITFPKEFTHDLYNGIPVKLPIVGNVNKKMDSFIVKSLLESVTRHIKAAQANILTVNNYAKQLPIDHKTRQEILFRQFTDFFLYTMGKDRLVREESITNNATMKPAAYYGFSSVFISLTVWLIAIYSFLTDQRQFEMQNRLRLYGAAEWKQILAKAVITLGCACVLTAVLFICIQHFLGFVLYKDDYLRIILIVFLYSIVFLEGLAIIELLVRFQKLRLLFQSIFTILTIAGSGALIPTLYFPVYIQGLLPYSFAAEGYHWLEEIILNGRFYIHAAPLIYMAGIGLFICIGISAWRERVLV